MASEKRFWVPELHLKGRIDAFVRNTDSLAQRLVQGKKAAVVGVEIKTTWSYGSRGTIETPAGTKAWPKWSHVVQAALYHWFYREFADYWVIYYLARDSGKARQHVLVVTEGGQISVNGELVPFGIEHIKARLGDLSRDLQLKEPPPRDFSIAHDKDRLKVMADAGRLGKTDTDKVRKGHKLVKGDWQCVYCEYVEHCWRGVDLPYDTPLEKLTKS
jgi:hypothetical protein